MPAGGAQTDPVPRDHADRARAGAGGRASGRAAEQDRPPRGGYFVVQNIYRGWALFGIALFGALATNLALAIVVRRQRAPFWLALASCLWPPLSVFFIWTYPANQATSNWTVVPADWQQLRTTWEYAHATNAVLTFLALCAVTWSVLVTRN